MSLDRHCFVVSICAMDNIHEWFLSPHSCTLLPVSGLSIESHCDAMVTDIFCSFGRGPPRFEGDRPRFGDREGYRGGPRGAPGDFGGDKGGAPAEFQPSFRVRFL